MSQFQRRGSIALASVTVALLSSRSVDAQVYKPCQPQYYEGRANIWASGIQHERADRAKAEWHLQRLWVKQCRDAERGDRCAVDLDSRRIENQQHRIAVDEWLIRKHMLQDPGYYPIRPGDTCPYP